MSTTMHLFRRVFGLVIALVALAALVSDLMLAYQLRQSLHVAHIIVAGVGMFVGGWLMNPPDAEAIADAVIKRLPMIAGLWPGGMRRNDPPPEPNVPLPPSVTGKEDL